MWVGVTMQCVCDMADLVMMVHSNPLGNPGSGDRLKCASRCPERCSGKVRAVISFPLPLCWMGKTILLYVVSRTGQGQWMINHGMFL